MGQKESKHPVVVTIHLGSTSNAYAFKFLRKMGRIHLNPNWGSEVSAPFWMTPNCLLYNIDGSAADCFGIKAEQQYFTQLDGGGDGGGDKPSLFRQFKKQLYGENSTRGTSFESDLKITSVDRNCEKSAVEVFADALKSLKEKVRAQLVHCCEWDRDMYESGSSEDNICWVVPMPDIWNKSWKAFLREACVKAELIKQKDSKNLLLPLESQCASLLCRQLTWDKFVELDQAMTPTFQKGVIYMIVNVEDEKVNVSVHQIDHGQNIEEVIEPIRALHDGKFIFSHLCDQLAKAFGDNFVEHIKTSKPYLLWEIMRDFSVAMKKYELDQVLHLKIHLDFANAYRQFSDGLSISDRLSRNNEETEIVLSEANGFAFSPSAVKEIVGNIAYDVKENVDLGIEKAKKEKSGGVVNYVFFVGELVDWKLVREEIRNIEGFYNHRPTVLIPPEAALSVLRGAVLYGQLPYKLKKKLWKH